MMFRKFLAAVLLVFIGPGTTQTAVLAWQVPVPKPYTNEAFAFSVAFKGEPVIDSKEIALEPKLKFVLSTFQHRFDRNLFGVMHISPLPLEKDWQELSPEEQQRLADEFFDGLAKTFLTSFETLDGKLTVKESRFQKNGYPAKEYQLGFSNKAKGTFRFYLVNSTGYCVFALYPADSKSWEEEARVFVNSFEFTPKPPVKPKIIFDNSEEVKKHQGL